MNDEAFLSTAAQIVPVLLLAIFIDGARTSRLSGGDRSSALAYLTVLLGLTLAEFIALTADAENGSLTTARIFVTLAITLGFLSLVVPLLRPAFEPLGAWASLLATVYWIVGTVLVVLEVVPAAVAGIVTLVGLVVLTYVFDPTYPWGRKLAARRATPDDT
ncbi:MAG: hypothetical protein JWO31_2160 [Phycisphaerales bacterium]|nr:hypothetical protein [Phycisphaerales bacterium]